MKEKKGIEAEHLYKLNSVVDPQVDSSGNDCLYVVTSICQKNDTYTSNIYYKSLEEDTEEVQWTFGTDRNHSPRWSPDSKKVVFVSNRTGKNQLFILNREGGEAKQLTNTLNGATNPVWSPDGLKVAFQTSLGKEKSIYDKEDEIHKNSKTVPFEVTNMKYKSDQSGLWDGKYQHIGMVDISTGELTEITTGENDYLLESWSPDGKYIAISADTRKDKDFSFCSDVFLYEIETDNWKKITYGTGYYGKATWSADGKKIGLIGHEREYENATYSKLWVYDVELEWLQCLTPDWDANIGDDAIGDFQQGIVTPGMLWGEDNESFVFLGSDHGNTIVYFGHETGAIYPSLIDNQHVYGLSTGGSLKRAVVAISKPQLPGDLFLLNLETGEVKQLTDINKQFAKEHEFAEAEAIQFQSDDEWELHGWLMKPIGFKTGETYPLILEIHGGPHAMYANTYFHEFQTLAANGFAVLYINPRGSFGYGQHFVDAVRGDYGNKDYEDIMAAVDYILANFDFIDETRLGVTGGSYGGFMTNWMIGHTNRFKAAVTQRSISNWISFYGVSDIGYYFSDWQLKADLTDVETLWKHSPLAYVEKIETPLLILHGEKDLRCPIEQAEQLFIALKKQKKTTKFIRFPESNHELSRSGKPSLRIERLNYIKNWFKEHLMKN